MVIPLPPTDPVTLPTRPILDGEYFMSADMGCQLCSDGSAWLGPLIFFVALGALCGAYVYNKERLKAWELRNRKWLTKFGFHFTQFLITTQIIVMLKINHER